MFDSVFLVQRVGGFCPTLVVFYSHSLSHVTSPSQGHLQMFPEASKLPGFILPRPGWEQLKGLNSAGQKQLTSCPRGSWAFIRTVGASSHFPQRIGGELRIKILCAEQALWVPNIHKPITPGPRDVWCLPSSPPEGLPHI